MLEFSVTFFLYLNSWSLPLSTSVVIIHIKYAAFCISSSLPALGQHQFAFILNFNSHTNKLSVPVAALTYL